MEQNGTGAKRPTGTRSVRKVRAALRNWSKPVERENRAVENNSKQFEQRGKRSKGVGEFKRSDSRLTKAFEII